MRVYLLIAAAVGLAYVGNELRSPFRTGWSVALAFVLGGLLWFVPPLRAAWRWLTVPVYTLQPPRRRWIGSQLSTLNSRP